MGSAYLEVPESYNSETISKMYSISKQQHFPRSVGNGGKKRAIPSQAGQRA